MNPYDFYSLDDFLEFSPLSPNYTNLNILFHFPARTYHGIEHNLKVEHGSLILYNSKIK
jgi:hypothetical protein